MIQDYRGASSIPNLEKLVREHAAQTVVEEGKKKTTLLELYEEFLRSPYNGMGYRKNNSEEWRFIKSKGFKLEVYPDCENDHFFACKPNGYDLGLGCLFEMVVSPGHYVTHALQGAGLLPHDLTDYLRSCGLLADDERIPPFSR